MIEMINKKGTAIIQNSRIWLNQMKQKWNYPFGILIELDGIKMKLHMGLNQIPTSGVCETDR